MGESFAPGQTKRREIDGLFAFEDRLDDVGSEESEGQRAADFAGILSDPPGQFPDGNHASVRQGFDPVSGLLPVWMTPA
jgi:hypothetical protein